MESTKKQKNRAMLEMLLCASLWSIAGIFIKLIPWSSFVIASIRSLIAGLIVLFFMLRQRIPFVADRGSLLGGVALCLTMMLFVTANKLTTAANAIVLQFTAPVFIVIFSAAFLKKRFTAADVIAVLFTMGGISLFFLDRLSAGHLLGNIIGVCSGVTFALYYMSLGEADESRKFSSILIADALAFLVGIPFIVTGGAEVTATSVVCIIILGVLQLGIPYVLLAKASAHCPPLACSLLGAAEPLLNPVWVFIFDGEAPGAFALAGGAVVIVTITLWCAFGDRKKAQTEAVSV